MALHLALNRKIEGSNWHLGKMTQESYKENQALSMQPQGLYSQHFIFFVTYEFAQEARALHYTRLERIARDKHSS